MSPPRNRLLAALPPVELATLLPMLDAMELAQHQVLHHREDPIAGLLFIESGCVSLLASLEDGEGVEATVVGHEGLVGVPLLLGEARAELHAVVRMPGCGLHLRAGLLNGTMERLPGLRRLLTCYVLARHGHATQLAACNVRHGIVQRLARTLLTAHDHADGQMVPMTHEILAMSLGVRRAGVTVAARQLHLSGCINYGAGRIAIADRSRLKAAACECHGVIQAAYARLRRTEDVPELEAAG